jgi:hypothetical protein
MAILKEDLIVFSTNWHTPKGRQIYPGGKWTCNHVGIFEVSRGYYVDFRDRTFEPAGWDRSHPESKTYMHYLRFKSSAASNPEILWSSRGSDGLRGLDFSPRSMEDSEVCRAFLLSNTMSGAPVELSMSALQSLRSRLSDPPPSS